MGQFSTPAATADVEPSRLEESALVKSDADSLYDLLNGIPSGVHAGYLNSNERQSSCRLTFGRGKRKTRALKSPRGGTAGTII